MWSSSPANRPPTAARPSVSHRGRTARTIVSTGLRAPGASARFFLDSERLSVSVCFVVSVLYSSMFHPNRMITRTPASAAVQSLMLPPPPPQKIPPSSPPGEAPSSSGMVRATRPASPTRRSARVKRSWLGATTTPR